MTSKLSKKFIQIADLYLAYRKSKTEAFFDNLHPSALAYTEYEKNLEGNLKNLFLRVTASDASWPQDCSFIGGHIYVPKSLSESDWQQNEDDVHYRAINPIDDWQMRFEASGKKQLTARYRLVITASVDYQILSALWILKVGHKFEFTLNKDVSFGNRLRRNRPNSFMKLWFQNGNGKLNQDCSGLFSPYFSGYQTWRERGLKSIKMAVKDGKSINAITMDLASFYHNVSPHFLLKKSFLAELEITLDRDERLFTEQFIQSIDTWYASTPDFKDRPEGAIPVGLSASKIISNVLLHQFDNEMCASLMPLYYGRYVDDIFLVVEAVEETKTGIEVLKWISKSVKCLKLEGNNTLRLNFSYARDSKLIFAPDKQKVFSLSSDHGLDFVDQISDQIRKHSSEYRLLPDVPITATEMASKALLATPSATLNADALRKADVVSVRRLGFSLLLRDIESYSRDLSPDAWVKIRQEFYGLVHRHLLNPKGIFEFTNYYPRIFSLMIACGDFDDAFKFVQGLVDCFELLGRTTNDGTIDQIKKGHCQAYFIKILTQASLQASTVKNFNSWTKLGRLLRQLFVFDDTFKIASTKRMLLKQSEELLFADWGARSYKDYWYYSQEVDLTGSPVPRNFSIKKIIRLGAIRKFQKFVQLKQPHWKALAFPTRPLTIQEIVLIAPSVLEDKKMFEDAISGLRGARVGSSKNLGIAKGSDSNNYYEVPLNKKQKIVRVALTSLETSDKQWSNVVNGKPDRSLERYKKIFGLVNLILQDDSRPHYVIFPECSIPRRWAFSMSHKLAGNGISMICGLEYYRNEKSTTVLRNDCFISLTTQWPGYRSSIIFMQPKLAPSHREKEKLKIAGKTQFIPDDGVQGLPIYNHGGYYFGVLIGSDMTDINSRAHYHINNIHDKIL